ncbi:hypothetical protein IL972_00030 [Acinetobacter sp. FL51]|uniref:hypothetical protein n=1 Tax=Acinetobacter sp. FL51 TaxID=2777978 RepID=UPI0018E19032|nr:hypothetical protein [Acinetobacter sp. FL51]MBI1450325.1 hypothetical protein [Acinetobacter sp. FL51]
MLFSTELFGDVVLLTSPALVGATEKIGFKTDIFESKNGFEIRTPLRDKARQTLGFSSVAIRKEIAQHFNVQYGGIRKNWAVPLYQESQYVGSVDSDFIECRTDIYSFYANSLAVLRNGSEFKIIEIASVESNGLKLAAPIAMANAKLYPVRLCFINGDIARQISGVHAHASITFNVIDEIELKESTPAQFLGDDLYFFCLTYSGGSMEATISQQQDIIDNQVSVVFQDTNWNFARYSKQYRAVIKNQAELYDYRRFLFRRQGRFRPFWLPTYESNMRCKSTGLVSSVLLVEHDQHKQLADLRKHIAIKSNGNWTAHTITASAPVAGNSIQVTISPALNKNASTIERISYLGLHRLDADNVELNYQGANIVEANVMIIEIGV